MTVAENITFGPRMKHWTKEARQQRLEEILSLVGLSGYESRNVAELSGGQRQRVALGRSLAPRPRLLMLDEPLGALDAAMRDRLALELTAILKLSGVTTIYVTHDQMEAFAIADRIAVMREGRIEQIGAPDALYQARVRHLWLDPGI
jgi:ABC-type Fe3+/spermidine/putrescine transport system ATPase subunit